MEFAPFLAAHLKMGHKAMLPSNQSSPPLIASPRGNDAASRASCQAIPRSIASPFARQEAGNKLMTTEQISKVKEFLDTYFPTFGDGCWSKEYILACAAGQQTDSMNYKTVIHAIKCSCPEFVFTNFSI